MKPFVPHKLAEMTLFNEGIIAKYLQNKKKKYLNLPKKKTGASSFFVINNHNINDNTHDSSINYLKS